MGEALQLWVYDKKGIVLSKSNSFIFPMTCISLVAAYLPLFFRSLWTIANPFFSIPSIILFVALGGYTLFYIVWGYKQYNTKLRQSLEVKFLFSAVMEQAKKSAFSDVSVKEADLAPSDFQNNNDDLYQNLTGYAYLNALFFARHRRQLVKPVTTRIIIIALIFLAGVICYFIKPELVAKLSNLIITSLPKFVFIMYFMSMMIKSKEFPDKAKLNIELLDDTDFMYRHVGYAVLNSNLNDWFRPYLPIQFLPVIGVSFTRYRTG